MTEPANAAPPGPVDRLLRVFGGYYILKTAREPLILLAGGAELTAGDGRRIGA
jgi:hypothetical protein